MCAALLRVLLVRALSQSYSHKLYGSQAVVSVPALAASEALYYFVQSYQRYDWPCAGTIDLDLHDKPHATSATEWWYYNMHFTGDGTLLRVCSVCVRAGVKFVAQTATSTPPTSSSSAGLEVWTKSLVNESFTTQRILPLWTLLLTNTKATHKWTLLLLVECM